MNELTSVDKGQWSKEIELIREYYKQFNHLPEEMEAQLAALVERFRKY